VPHRRHVVAEAGEAVPSGRLTFCELGAAVLGEARVEEAQHRDVQAVEPDHRVSLDAASLPWSCQVQLGVMMKSPGRIVVRSPSTAVQAPLPSTMKRSALCVWRWLGAISPGMMSCRPA
jgi:hypothetical protein